MSSSQIHAESKDIARIEASVRHRGAAAMKCESDRTAHVDPSFFSVRTALIHECTSMFGSLMGASFEGMAIDNELIGQPLRCVRGIEVKDDPLSLEVIQSRTGPTC